MTDPLDKPGTALALAQDIAAKLQQQLDTFGAETINLSREDAVITLGLVNAIIEELGKSSIH